MPARFHIAFCLPVWPRLAAVGLLAILIPELGAVDLATVDGQATTLHAQIKSPKTLVLIVTDEHELLEAQRILTIPAERNPSHTVVLVALPPQGPLQDKMLRLTAKSFFQSDFSRERVFLSSTADLAGYKAKALLFEPGRIDPIFRYQAYPEL